jgi:hypothetical protein
VTSFFGVYLTGKLFVPFLPLDINELRFENYRTYREDLEGCKEQWLLPEYEMLRI